MARKFLPVITTALLAAGATGCTSKTSSNNDPFTKEGAVAEMRSRAARGEINPVIIDDGVVYQNSDGDIVYVEGNKAKTLFEAVNENCTPSTPYITDIGGLKASLYAKTHNFGDGRAENIYGAIMVNDLTGEYTKPNSEGGDTLTRNEVETIMDVWGQAFGRNYEVVE